MASKYVQLAMTIGVSILGALPSFAETKTADFEAGKKIYMSKCEVCHLIGRNVINPEKEIQNSKLVEDQKKLKEFLSQKHGAMPPFIGLSKNDQKIIQLQEFLQYAKKHPSELLKVTNATPKAEEKSGAQTTTKRTESSVTKQNETTSTKKSEKTSVSKSEKK